MDVVPIGLARDTPAGWDDYVSGHAGAKAYHVAAWPRTVATTFRLESHWLTANDASGRITGVLPLVRQRSVAFGDRLTSLPFFNYGGALADDDGTRIALMSRSRALAGELGVDRLELRDTTPPPPGWPHRADKAALMLELPDSAAALIRSYGSKLRSQIKRAAREGPVAVVGGAAQLPGFYAVFAHVMRDLGTPVYPPRFFERLVDALPESCTIVTVRSDGRPVAAAFLVGYRDTLEVPWAATLPEMKTRATNMFLYSTLLELAVERGYRRFDFGRSTIDSGPYRFKLQWGAEPVPLYWSVWPAERAAAHGTSGPGTALTVATKVWSRLPLAVANRLGPLISPGLPW